MPPDELLEELRVNKPILIEYLKHTSRDLSMLAKRATRWLPLAARPQAHPLPL